MSLLRKLAIFLCSSLLAVSATAQSVGTANVVFNFTNYVAAGASLYQLTVTPCQRVQFWNGNAVLTPKPLFFSAAIYPGMTNGMLTISNLIAGYNYGVTNGDGYIGFHFELLTNYSGQTVNVALLPPLSTNLPSGAYAYTAQQSLLLFSPHIEGGNYIAVTNDPVTGQPSVNYTGGGGGGSTATFYPGNNTQWRTAGDSNVVDVVGTLTNNTTGSAATATTAGTATTATNAAPGGNIVTNSLEVWINTNGSVQLPDGTYTNFPASTTLGIQETYALYPFNTNLLYSSTPVINLKPGYYPVGQLNFTNNNVILRGAGPNATMLRYTGATVQPFIVITTLAAAANPVVQATNGANAQIEGINISYGKTNCLTPIITVTNNQFMLDNCVVAGPFAMGTLAGNQTVLTAQTSLTNSGLVGIELNCQGPPTKIRNCMFIDLADGIHIPPTGNYATIEGCTFTSIGCSNGVAYTNLYPAVGANSIYNFGAAISIEAGYGQFVVRDCYFQAVNACALLFTGWYVKFEDNLDEQSHYGYLASANDPVIDAEDSSTIPVTIVNGNPNQYLGNNFSLGGGITRNAAEDNYSGLSAIFYEFPNTNQIILGASYIEVDSQNLLGASYIADGHTFYSTTAGFNGVGSGITALNAANLSSGGVSTSNTFVGNFVGLGDTLTNRVGNPAGSGHLAATNAPNFHAATMDGNALLTTASTLNGANLTAGSVADAALASTFLKASTIPYTATNIFALATNGTSVSPTNLTGSTIRFAVTNAANGSVSNMISTALGIFCVWVDNTNGTTTFINNETNLGNMNISGALNVAGSLTENGTSVTTNDYDGGSNIGLVTNAPNHVVISVVGTVPSATTASTATSATTANSATYANFSITGTNAWLATNVTSGISITNGNYWGQFTNTTGVGAGAITNTWTTNGSSAFLNFSIGSATVQTNWLQVDTNGIPTFTGGITNLGNLFVTGTQTNVGVVNIGNNLNVGNGGIITGNGSGLTAINGANVSTVASATTANNLNFGIQSPTLAGPMVTTNGSGVAYPSYNGGALTNLTAVNGSGAGNIVVTTGITTAGQAPISTGSGNNYTWQALPSGTTITLTNGTYTNGFSVAGLTAPLKITGPSNTICRIDLGTHLNTGWAQWGTSGVYTNLLSGVALIDISNICNLPHFLDAINNSRLWLFDEATNYAPLSNSMAWPDNVGSLVNQNDPTNQNNGYRFSAAPVQYVYSITNLTNGNGWLTYMTNSGSCLQGDVLGRFLAPNFTTNEIFFFTNNTVYYRPGIAGTSANLALVIPSTTLNGISGVAAGGTLEVDNLQIWYAANGIAVSGLNKLVANNLYFYGFTDGAGIYNNGLPNSSWTPTLTDGKNLLAEACQWGYENFGNGNVSVLTNFTEPYMTLENCGAYDSQSESFSSRYNSQMNLIHCVGAYTLYGVIGDGGTVTLQNPALHHDWYGAGQSGPGVPNHCVWEMDGGYADGYFLGANSKLNLVGKVVLDYPQQEQVGGAGSLITVFGGSDLGSSVSWQDVSYNSGTYYGATLITTLASAVSGMTLSPLELTNSTVLNNYNGFVRTFEGPIIVSAGNNTTFPNTQIASNTVTAGTFTGTNWIGAVGTNGITASGQVPTSTSASGAFTWQTPSGGGVTYTTTNAFLNATNPIVYGTNLTLLLTAAGNSFTNSHNFDGTNFTIKMSGTNGSTTPLVHNVTNNTDLFTGNGGGLTNLTAATVAGGGADIILVTNYNPVTGEPIVTPSVNSNAFLAAQSQQPFNGGLITNVNASGLTVLGQYPPPVNTNIYYFGPNAAAITNGNAIYVAGNAGGVTNALSAPLAYYQNTVLVNGQNYTNCATTIFFLTLTNQTITGATVFPKVTNGFQNWCFELILQQNTNVGGLTNMPLTFDTNGVVTNSSWTWRFPGFNQSPSPPTNGINCEMIYSCICQTIQLTNWVFATPEGFGLP